MACPFCDDGEVVDPDASAEVFWGYETMPCPICGATKDWTNVPLWGQG